ncbi:MAG: alpha/beta fold hydrolase [Proteobacteria bacterium]|nr:alpha/beta fold hydrolase [Pseudomonadota bacterium]
MSQAFRLGFELYAGDEKASASDAHWALSALDPSTPVLCGRFTASDHAEIPYRLWPARRPRALILLLHGATDYSGAFDEIGPRFAAAGLTALAIDQRGFGATASRGQWRGKNRMIRDAIEAVHFLKRRATADLPVFILGESMGAALAVHVAARAPDLELAGLVLSAPGAISGTWRRVFGSFLTRVLRFLIPNAGFIIERLNAWEFTPAAAIRLLSDPMVLRRVKPAMLFGLFKLSRSAVDEAEHVHVPVLTMVGSREDILRVACIERLHAGLSGVKMWQRFRDGPHLLLHWKHSDRVIGTVLRWLDARLSRRVYKEPRLIQSA